MKPLKNFLLILPLFFFYPKAPKVISPEIYKTINESHLPKDISVNAEFLKYEGSLFIKTTSIFVRSYISIAPAIGIRYDATFTDVDGNNIMSNISIYFKFSNPNQSVYYNHLTHESYIITNDGNTNGGNPNVTVMGTETIDKYQCTHLVQKSGKGIDEFWMSTKIPGFATILKKLYKVDPNLIMGMNATIFNWGGLVKFKSSYKGNEIGDFVLVEANPNQQMNLSEFDPPKK